jgi:O-antigen/teichoic acid export membrane protein
MANPFSAVRWVIFSSFGFRFISLGGQMLILRMVDKDVFGSWRGIILIHMMCLTLLPVSLDTLVIREKRNLARYTMAVTMMLAAMGGFLALAALAFTCLPLPLGGSLAGQWLHLGPEANALMLMGPIFLVMAAKMSIRSVLNAELDFKAISIGEFGNGIITWIGGALAVLWVPHVWALMTVYLLGEVFECCWMYRGRPFRLGILSPKRWGIFRKIWKKHQSYCLLNSANLTLNNVASSLPGVLFVALISAEANADFSVAMMLLVLPTMLLTGALSRVAFPSLSGVSEKELQRRCLLIIGGAAAFIAPTVLWFAFFSPTTVWVLAGSDYLASTPPLVYWIAIYMILAAVFGPINSIEMIRDRPDLGLYWNAVFVVGRVSLIVWLAKDGLLAVVSAIAIFSFVMWIIQAYICGRLLRAGLLRYFWTPGKYIPMWVLACLGFQGCWMATGGHLIYAPLMSVLVGVVYLILVLKFYPSEARLLKKFMGRG